MGVGNTAWKGLNECYYLTRRRIESEDCHTERLGRSVDPRHWKRGFVPAFLRVAQVICERVTHPVNGLVKGKSVTLIEEG